MRVDMAAVRATVAYWQSLTEEQKLERAQLAQKRARRAQWNKEAEDATAAGG